MRLNQKLSLLMFLVWVICMEDRAWAYTDPGSGILLLQTLVAVGAGLLFFLRRFIRWISSFGAGKTDKEPNE